MKADQERVRNLLTDTVTLLCKNGLQYQTELRVQGVLGITLDNNDVFIVHINEKFGDAIGGALTIRNDEGDAAKTLLGSTRLGARKSHDAIRGETLRAVNSQTGEVHRWQRRSRESTASPALPTNSQQLIKINTPSKEKPSPSEAVNLLLLHNSSRSASDVHSSEGFLQIKVKTEVDGVVIVEQNQGDRSKMGCISQDIPHRTDQCAMQESYPNLSLSELQGSYQPFGEILGVTDTSTNSGADGTAPPDTKRRATISNTHNSFDGSSEMESKPDVGGPFITGIIQNETMTGVVAPQTTTATSWDPSQIPDFGTLTSRDSQMILDSTPGCSTWDTLQQSQASAATTTMPHVLPNMSNQSSESVCPAGRSNRVSTGQGDKGAQLTTVVSRSLPSVAELNKDRSQQMLGNYKRDYLLTCTHCGKQFMMKSKLMYHIKSKHLGKRYTCTWCQCTFVTKSGLNSHVRHIHENVPRYKCEQCGKGYSDRSNYFDHIATHTGVKRNTCSICQKQFTFRRSLKTHIEHFHSNDAAHV